EERQSVSSYVLKIKGYIDNLELLGHPVTLGLGYLAELLKKKKNAASRAGGSGYLKETMGYSFYYPPENKILVARNAEFLENCLITQEASGSLEDLKIIQEEDTHPSIDTSLNHEEDDQEFDEPQSDIVLIRRSIRTRHAPDRMCLYIDAEEHKLGDLGELANYKAALLDPESDKWLNAMNVEMQSMKNNEVWVLVKLPPNGKTIGSKWVLVELPHK
nr:Gag/Pol protein [Tanacetum cinerariifolium]